MITVKREGTSPANVPQGNLGNYCDDNNFYFFETKEEAQEYQQQQEAAQAKMPKQTPPPTIEERLAAVEQRLNKIDNAEILTKK